MAADDKLDSAEYVLTTTRSVRKRLDLARPVPRSTVEECLQIALQAPNGSNLNTWRWVVVDERDTIRRIGELYAAAMDDYVRRLGAATGADYAGADIPGFARIADSVDYLRDHMGDMPAVALPLIAGRLEGAGLFMQASLWGSSLQSVWSFFLALRTRGLGSCWTTAHLWREAEFAELLGIPADRYTQVGLFPVAYTIGTDFRPAWRRPVNEVLSWNRFDD